MTARLRILTLFVRHGTDRYAGALDDLRTFQRTRAPSARHDLVVVDNAIGRAPPSSEDDHVLLGGSNVRWEFSAWDEALAHVGARVWDYDLVHLVTSAFRTLHTRFIDLVDERLLARIVGRGAALGHIDCYNEPVELLGIRTQHWLRSSFLFVPPAELALLGPLDAVPPGSTFFSGDPSSPFRPDAPISPAYRRCVLDWLTGAGTGQGTVWHSRFELGPETLAHFQAKTLAILDEHLLAIRLRRQGCALVDVTWLATNASRYAPGDPIPFPGWRDQLAGRDADALRIPLSTA